MKKNLLLTLPIILIAACTKHALIKEGSITSNQEQQATVEREGEWTRQSVTINGNDAYINSLPDSVEVAILIGDSWNNNFTYDNWGYNNLLIPNKIFGRAIFGTTHVTYLEFLRRLRVLRGRTKTYFSHSGTNDIGLSHPLETIKANMRIYYDTLYSISPYAEVVFQYVEPHPKFWAAGWKDKIIEVNKYMDTLVMYYTAQGKKARILDTYSAFLGADGSPNLSLYDNTQYHYNSAGQQLLRNMIVQAANTSNGKSFRDSITPAPVIDSNKAPVASTAYTSATSTTVASNWFPVLNGNASKDPDGWIASYSWAKVSGPACTITPLAETNGTIAGRAKVTNWTYGVYVFRLTVTDNKGKQSSADISITVN